jgi:hypothetical protein
MSLKDNLRPLNIFTQLTAALGAVFMEGVDANSQKVTLVADGTVTDDAINLGQLTSLSGGLKTYVDAADALLQGNLDSVSGAMKSYVDAADAAQNSAASSLSSSLKYYIDAADAAQDIATAAISSSIVAYVDAENAAQDQATSALSSSLAAKVQAVDTAQTAANAALSSSMKGYVDAQNTAQDAATSALSSSIVAYVDAADAAQDAATAALSSSLVAKIDAADSQLQTNINTVSSSVKSYVDAADAQIQSNLDGVSGSLKSYIDAQDTAQNNATSALSSSIKSYVDAADLAQDTATAVLSSSIKSYVDAADAQIQSNLDGVSGSLKTYADTADAAQDSAMAALSSSIKGYVDAADLVQDTATTALSSSARIALVNEAKDRQAADSMFLKLDGSRSMSGSLNMGGQDIVNAKSGSFSGDVTIAGDLQVNGATTSINSTDLQVTDKLVTIAKGAANGAAADGAGIFVDGADVSFVYDNASGKWVSNVGLEVSNQGSFDAAMKLSGSAFTNIATAIVGGKFDVSDAIHALDTKVGADSSAIKSKYDGLREVITGTLGAGGVEEHPTAGYFNSVGDFLQMSDNNSAFDLSNTDSTIEMWFYPTTTIGAHGLIGKGTYGVNEAWFIAYEATGFIVGNIGGNNWIIPTTITANSWYHIAITSEYSTGTKKFWLNGNLLATRTGGNFQNVSSNVSIGTLTWNKPDNVPMVGYIDDVRITRNIRYSTSFTPPTNITIVGDPYASSVSFLVTMDGYINSKNFVDTGINGLTVTANGNVRLRSVSRDIGDAYASNVSLVMTMNGTSGSTSFVDESFNNLTLTRLGNAALTTTADAGRSSVAYFDGSSCLKLQDNFDLSNTDSTIEMWFKTTSTQTQGLIGKGTYAVNESWFVIFDSTGFYVGIVNNGVWFVPTAVTPNNWYHVAITSDNSTSTKKFWLNGNLIATTTGKFKNVASPVGIGAPTWNNLSNVPFVGYIDDLRITNVARYTTNFTPTLQLDASGGGDAGSATVDLSFATAELSNIALDVMVNEGDGYNNNLVSSKMFVDGTKIKVQIDAPAAAVGTAYRVIAVNEKKGGLA